MEPQKVQLLEKNKKILEPMANHTERNNLRIAEFGAGQGLIAVTSNI